MKVKESESNDQITHPYPQIDFKMRPTESLLNCFYYKNYDATYDRNEGESNKYSWSLIIRIVLLQFNLFLSSV